LRLHRTAHAPGKWLYDRRAASSRVPRPGLAGTDRQAWRHVPWSV